MPSALCQFQGQQLLQGARLCACVYMGGGRCQGFGRPCDCPHARKEANERSSDDTRHAYTTYRRLGVFMRVKALCRQVGGGRVERPRPRAQPAATTAAAARAGAGARAAAPDCIHKVAADPLGWSEGGGGGGGGSGGRGARAPPPVHMRGPLVDARHGCMPLLLHAAAGTALSVP